MSKEKFQNLLNGAKDLGKKAGQVSKDVVSAAGAAKGAIQKGVSTGKTVIEKAAKVVNKETIGQGLDATSRGIEVAAKGASKLAETMKNVSKKMKS